MKVVAAVAYTEDEIDAYNALYMWRQEVGMSYVIDMHVINDQLYKLIFYYLRAPEMITDIEQEVQRRLDAKWMAPNAASLYSLFRDEEHDRMTIKEQLLREVDRRKKFKPYSDGIHWRSPDDCSRH